MRIVTINYYYISNSVHIVMENDTISNKMLTGPGVGGGSFCEKLPGSWQLYTYSEDPFLESVRYECSVWESLVYLGEAAAMTAWSTLWIGV